jgi:hypothetical protein
MDLYFGGCEQSGHMDLLYANGVRHMSLSFVGLSNRNKKGLNSWLLADHFPDDVHIHLDSGAYSLNQEDSKYDESQVRDLDKGYAAFVSNNAERISMASEFNADILGVDILDNRREYYRGFLGNKFLPVVSSSDIRVAAQHYRRVGLLQPNKTAIMLLAPILNRTVMDTGVKLHGIAMTSMSLMKQINWDSVGSLSWLTPSRFGDTIIWNGLSMDRYPRNYKDRARSAHGSYLRDQGFDVELIMNDDVTENLRLSIWSWLKFVEDINKTRSRVTQMQNSHDVDNAETGSGEVAHIAPPVRTDAVAVPSGRTMLPVFGIKQEEHKEYDEDGNETTVSVPHLTVPDASLMQCNTCVVQDKCPAFTPGASCSYDIPVRVRMPSQLTALKDTLIEMQTQRVMMLRFMEQLNGGQADPNLGPEVDRLQRMIKQKDTEGKITMTNFSQVTVPAEGAGAFSRIFGEKAASKLREVEAPHEVDSADIIEAEVIDNE